MSTISFETTGVGKLNRFYAILPRILKNKLEDQMIVQAEKTRLDIIKGMITTPKTGRTYTRAFGRKHIASSPGNPPAIDTGALSDSVKFKIVGRDIVFTAEQDYASFLEEGTKKMRPRPFFNHVIESNHTKSINSGTFIGNVLSNVRGAFG